MHNLKWEQVDVKTTFLHGELNEQICMQQPEVVWFEPITQAMGTFMVSCGYSHCDYNCCVYSRRLNDDSFFYLTLYVDDMMIAAKSISHISALKTILTSEFEMKELEATKRILSIGDL